MAKRAGRANPKGDVPKRYTVNKDGTITLPLLVPVKIGTQPPIEELVFRRLLGKELQEMSDEPDMAELLDVAWRVCVPQQTPVVMERMDVADCLQVCLAMSHFFENGPPTGG